MDRKTHKDVVLSLQMVFPKNVGDDPSVSKYGKCNIIVMEFHRYPQYIILGHFWIKCEIAINKYVNQWAPNIGWAGQQVSLLDLDPEYLNHACPEKY